MKKIRSAKEKKGTSKKAETVGEKEDVRGDQLAKNDVQKVVKPFEIPQRIKRQKICLTVTY